MTNQPTTKLVRVPEDELAALKAENERLRCVADNAARDIRWKLQSRVDGLLTANQIQDIAAIAARIEKELEATDA